MAESMRAAVLAGPERATVELLPRPRPAAGQLLVAVEGSGVCGSDLPVWVGTPWTKYPLPPGAPGHEGFGRVTEVGAGARGFEPGERVAFLSSAAWAEYAVVDATAALKLPAALDGKPFPAEPLACAFNAFRRSDVRAGQTVAVIGIGFLGALLTRLAADAGARVIAVSRRPFALELARRFGAAEALRLDDRARVVDEVRRLTEGAWCERVFEVVGAQEPLDLAGQLAAERGRLIIAGYHQNGPRQVDMQLWNWRGLDVVNAHERDPEVYLQGMREAVEAVVSGRLDPSPLFTHRFGLGQVGEALETMRRRPDGFLKALIIP